MSIIACRIRILAFRTRVRGDWSGPKERAGKRGPHPYSWVGLFWTQLSFSTVTPFFASPWIRQRVATCWSPHNYDNATPAFSQLPSNWLAAHDSPPHGRTSKLSYSSFYSSILLYSLINNKLPSKRTGKIYSKHRRKARELGLPNLWFKLRC